MKESYSFGQIKGEIERKKKRTEIKPLTAEEHQDMGEKPMTLKDHWLSLRYSIQEKLAIPEPTAEEQERTMSLGRLISPELMSEYQEILKSFNGKVQKTKEHPQREYIDVNAAESSEGIEKWITNLIREVQDKKESGLNESDSEELRAQCWILFDAIGNVMNTKSLEKDIADFYGDETPTGDDENEKDEEELQKQKSILIHELQGRYPLDEVEIGILVDLVRSGEGESYSPKVLVETISRLWDEYSLGERKGKIAKISLGYLLAQGVESFTPSLFQDMLAEDKFNMAAFFEFLGLNKMSEVINAKIDVDLAKMMNEINHQINGRITNSLFFQEFEFIHEKSLGEIFATLSRGKSSTEQILQDVISKFTPTLAGIGMSLAFLSKINPALGAIGLVSLPAMYRIAKKQNEQIWPMYEKERTEGEKITTRLGSIKSGFEEVKTSPETPAVASLMKEQMDIKDTLSLRRYVEEAKMRLLRMIPFDVSTVIAGSVGAALQSAGMISGGAVLSSIIYSDRLNRPVHDLVNLYFSRFSRYIQDIQRMDEILGGYEKLDLPEGEKEKDRVPVSELSNFDISIRDLRYKNVLHGVNIDIKQGEFLTISGTSGAGKSTLLRNLVGLYKPDGGDIEIGGVKSEGIRKYGGESLYSMMSYCNQSPQIFAGMTLRENLLLWSKESTDDENIKKVLRDLHLDKFIDRLDEEATHLSGGEKVRIGVARTLIKGAKIMLLDEPTASLDSQAATEVRRIISEIHEKYPDTTIICVSHDVELQKLSKRLVNIADIQAQLV